MLIAEHPSSEENKASGYQRALFSNSPRVPPVLLLCPRSAQSGMQELFRLQNDVFLENYSLLRPFTGEIRILIPSCTWRPNPFLPQLLHTHYFATVSCGLFLLCAPGCVLATLCYGPPTFKRSCTANSAQEEESSISVATGSSPFSKHNKCNGILLFPHH